MKPIASGTKKINITFPCDICGVATTCQAEVPTNEITLEAICSVCSKEFSVRITPTFVEVSDIEDDVVAIEFD